MKKSIILAAAVAALAMFASCQKEELESASSGNDLVFTATIDNSATRTIINTDGSDTDNRGKVSWELGDEITIYDMDPEEGAYNPVKYIASTVSGSSATFTKKPVETGSLNDSGPYSATYGSTSLTNQIHSATAGRLPMWTSSSSTNLKFSVNCGLLKLTLTKASEKISSIAVIADNITYTLLCNNMPVDISEGADFFIAIPAKESDGGARYTTIILTNSIGETCEIVSTSGGHLILPNSIQPITLSSRINFALGSASAWIDGKDEMKVPYIRLWDGGPKWATINLGVNDPAATTSYGGYYAWSSDDIATSTWGSDWGSNWRMPTKSEFDAMLENCTCTFTDGGLLVTGKGDYASKSIFLPAAGLQSSGSTSEDGINGYYWSSNYPDSGNAYCLDFYSDDNNVTFSARSNCFSIRPVLNEGQEEVNFPDAKLKAYMLSNFDTNGDGKISMLEANAVTSVNCSGLGVTDLTGLEYCFKLESLNFSNNSGITSANLSTFLNLSVLDAGLTSIMSLDVSHNPELVNLSVSACPCTTLDLSHNPKLETLNVGSSYLTSLDIRNNTALRELWVHYTKFSSLDLSANNSLEKIYANNSDLTTLNLSGKTVLKEVEMTSCTALTSLNVTGCTALTKLNICNNPALASVDLTTVTNLTTLDIGNTGITTLDLSQNTQLKWLSVALCGSLTSLDLSSNTKLESLTVSNSGLTTLNLSNVHQALTSLNITGCNNLSVLDVGLTGIKSLDVSQNPALESLSISGCGCQSLNLSNNTKLETLNVGASGLSSLDISHNTALKNLYIHHTTFSSLNLSANNSLEKIYARNSALTTLDLSGKTVLKELDVASCSALTSLNVTNCTALEKIILWDCTALNNLTNVNKTTRLYVTTTKTNPLKKTIYQVGQLVVPDDDRDCAGSTGIVYTKGTLYDYDYKEGDGPVEIRTQIISLDEGNEVWDKRAGSRVASVPYENDNGEYNTSWLNDKDYAAAQWCTDHGSGWYLPSIIELVVILKNKFDSINSALSALGSTTLSSTDAYWSSNRGLYEMSTTGMNKARVYTRSLDDDAQEMRKSDSNHVRAICTLTKE